MESGKDSDANPVCVAEEQVGGGREQGALFIPIFLEKILETLWIRGYLSRGCLMSASKFSYI